MPIDAQAADSSPAPSTPATFDLGSLNESERTEWRLSGKLPEPKAAEESAAPDVSSPADSTPAEPVEQVASTDALPEAASEPATPRKSKADARFQELLAERQRERDRADTAERRLAAMEARQTKQDAVPAPSPASATEFPAYDVWAQQHDDGSYEDYLLGRFEHIQTQKQTVAQQHQAAEQFSRTAQERVETFTARYREALAADASLPTRINARLYDLKTVDACLQSGEPVTALNAVAQEIVESPHAVKLLTHLSDHPDELATLSSLSPAAVIRAMAKLESQLDLPAIPPRKTVSTAPALTTTLGSRPAVPGDPLKAAITSGDYPRYRDAMNARDMAGVK